VFVEEKRVYPQNDQKGFPEEARAKMIVKEISFSQDPRDFGHVKESIPCQDACPAKTNIPGYIRCIYEKRYGRSYELNRMYNILPGVLGRICSRPCEEMCRHGEVDLGTPVNICHLKRSASDLKPDWHMIKENFYAPTGKTVAVIGAGPAGLAAAHELTTLGHRVTIYEALDKPGGMLMYGIPAFRLPRNILEFEIDNILRLGVDLKTNVKIGEDISVSDLLKKHDAVIVAAGCQEASMPAIQGEELEGSYSGLDFVMRVNRGEQIDVGKRVAVIGGGYTAIDCARLAIRLGASTVTINIRKTEEYMRVDENEKHEAKLEKIRIYGLVQPVRINGKKGRVESINFVRTRLEYTKGGLGRRSVPIPNSEFEVPVDTVILAIGQNPDTSFIGRKINLDGKRILTRKDSFKTSIKGLYASGDCITGSTNVITAIAQGRKAANEVDEYFIGRKRRRSVVRFETSPGSDRKRSYDFIPSLTMPILDAEKRLKKAANEVELGYDDKTSREESKRCYLCSLKFQIDTDRCIYCSACIDVAPRDCIKLIKGVEIEKDGTYGELSETNNWHEVLTIAIDSKRCIRCGQCYEVCPMNCITITKVELVEQELKS
jgi:glutamate synthase (NADPH/NADH) small chain